MLILDLSICRESIFGCWLVALCNCYHMPYAIQGTALD